MARIPSTQGKPYAAGEDSGTSVELRITVLTIAILALIGILLMFTGYQAAESERQFFREVAMNANQEIATLVGRQFAQTFTNSTGLLEDLARFPAAVNHDMAVVDELFGVLLKRHDIFRVLYMLDENGKLLKVRYNIGATKFRPLAQEKFGLLKRKEVTTVLSDFYTQEEDPAITFACQIVDRQTDQFKGVLGAELNLNFIQDILASVRVGHTGEIVLVDASGNIIFSSPGFAATGGPGEGAPGKKSPSQQDFQGSAGTRGFDVTGAFQREKGTAEYAGHVTHLSAFQRIRAILSSPIPNPRQPFFNPLTPGMIPDWMVVVQQNAEEALMVADRMKYNLIILVVVGVIGLMVIARLWLDSL